MILEHCKIDAQLSLITRSRSLITVGTYILIRVCVRREIKVPTSSILENSDIYVKNTSKLLEK